MKTDRMRNPSRVVIALAGIISSSLAITSWASGYGGHGNNACFKTTRLMKNACRSDIVDDYFEEAAKCINSSDPRECTRDARAELREAREDCGVQAEGRDALCKRLPDTGPYIVEIDPDDFNGVNGSCTQAGGQNQYYPLVVGTITTFVNEEDEETIIVTVTDETREILGVETVVVRDTVYEGLPDDDGKPTGPRIEDTDDYYATHANCDVWYFGEVSQNFEDGFLDNLDGSFIGGVSGAQPGIIMLGNPQVGDVYRQEFALGDAEDAGAVLDLAADVEIENDDFACNGMCLKTEDFIANEPDAVEFKYFNPGIGFLAEQLPGGEVVLELIKLEVIAP